MPGSRIVSVEVGGEPIDSERIYVLSTRGYMARGKDGYKSLLVQPEGGTCEEVVSEENGMLISAILRQYFMSLKVMDQWKQWSPSLAQHWARVASGIAKCHPTLVNPAGSLPSSPVRERGQHPFRRPQRQNSWAEWTARKLRERRCELGPLAENDDGESDDEAEDEVREEVEDIDRELAIMRRTFTKWCLAAGVNAKVCDDLKQEEIDAAWTKAVSPRVEGRIQVVGVAE